MRVKYEGEKSRSFENLKERKLRGQRGKDGNRKETGYAVLDGR